MSGILSILREALAIFFPNQIPQRSLFWNCTIIAFVISASILWYLENKKSINLARELKEEKNSKKSKLDGKISFLRMGAGGEKNESTIIVMMARITNTGAPSIVIDYELTVKIGDKQTNAIPIAAAENNLLKDETGGPTITFKAEEYLPRKSMSHPIERGGAVEGFILFLVPSITNEEISNNGVIILNFRDIDNKLYSTELVPRISSAYQLLDPNKLQKKN